jgi:hypothetical protein
LPKNDTDGCVVHQKSRASESAAFEIKVELDEILHVDLVGVVCGAKSRHTREHTESRWSVEMQVVNLVAAE